MPNREDNPPISAGQVRCLKCGKMWLSPDRRGRRICPKCTTYNAVHAEKIGIRCVSTSALGLTPGLFED